MKNKKNIVIIIFLVIIILGVGYFIGNNSAKNDKTTKVSSRSSESVKSSSSTSSSESTTSTSLTQSTSESSAEVISETLPIEEEATVEQQAFDKMLTLQGKWGVPQTDNIFTIQSDGSWTTHQLGSDETITIPVQVLSFDEASNILYLTVDGFETTLKIISNSELYVSSGNGMEETFILIQ